MVRRPFFLPLVRSPEKVTLADDDLRKNGSDKPGDKVFAARSRWIYELAQAVHSVRGDARGEEFSTEATPLA